MTQTSLPTRPKVFLIDGYANIFRAYYAIRNLSSSKGEPTNAVFGFLQILRKLMRDEDPAYLGVALDVSDDTTHRRDMFEAYKANRRPTPEDLKPQIPWIRKVIAAYKIPMLEMPKYEADDVLGTLAKKAVAAGFEVILVSPDKDLMQLVGDGVFQQHTGRDKLYDARAVEEDFGVPPRQVVDVLALMGDASDNVPGVPGIGEKGAKQLIQEHGSLDNLLAKAADLPKKAHREGLTEHRDKALLSRELVTIHTDLPIDFDPLSLQKEEPDWEQLLEICFQLDFHGLAKEIEAARGPKSLEVAPILELRSAAAVADFFADRHEIAVAKIGDTPTIGLALGRAGAQDATEAVLVDFRQDGMRAAALAALAGALARQDLVLVGHDLKEVLRLAGAEQDVVCRLFDTMLISYLTRSALRSHDFAAVALDRLRVTPTTPQEAGLGKSSDPMPGDPALLRFAGEHATLPLRLLAEQRQALVAAGLEEVYRRFEEELIPVLVRMEERGIGLDLDYLRRMSQELEVEIGREEQEIYRLAGMTFNIQSPQQLGEIMFEKLGYPTLRKTRKTKQYSTDAETLEELATLGYELPQRLTRYRELTKLKSTYLDALPVLADARGRIHSRFNQAVAATGRLSSANPNLQNIPIRTELGQRIRKAFRADPGNRLVVADYSQIELRVLAHVADEQVMIDAFARGEDIHASTAAAVFGGSPLLVSAEQRRMAKVINFGILYGMTPFGLARQLGIPRKDAEEFIERYLERYPGVRRYTEETEATAIKNGEVRTMFGRIRAIPDITSRNFNLRENAKRMAINAPIQGAAADLLKLAMIAIDRRLRRELPRVHLLLTVHDELVLEAPEHEAELVAQLLKVEMAGVAALKVPLEVEVGIGETWYDAKK